jgi:hypothetical protein
MAIPASGPISMSMLNVEVGKSSNAANTLLAGGSTPTVGSLFWLGAQSGSLNQTAPHAISEWYGYTANPPVPAPFIRFDASESSFVGTTVSNIGNGGTTYNLTAGSGVTLGGSGGGSYFNFATGNQGLTSSFLPFSLSASSFTIDFWVRTPGTTGSLYFFGETGSAPFNRQNGTTAFLPNNSFIEFANYTASAQGWGGIRTSSISLDTWTQYTFVYEYSTSAFNNFFIYKNGVLQDPSNPGTFTTKIPSSSTSLIFGTGRPYNVGNLNPQGPATMSFANWSFWTSSLTSASIASLYQQFDARY